jgi:hypothetical protein
MKPVRSVKHRMDHVDFHVSKSVIRTQSELIHEHDFIQVAFKGSDTLIRCVTCGTYYCELCGKELSDLSRSIFYA